MFNIDSVSVHELIINCFLLLNIFFFNFKKFGLFFFQVHVFNINCV